MFEARLGFNLRLAQAPIGRTVAVVLFGLLAAPGYVAGQNTPRASTLNSSSGGVVASQGGCAAQRSEARALAAKGGPLPALKKLRALYASCSTYDDGLALAEAEADAGDYDEARILAASLLAKEDRAGPHSVLGKIAASRKDYKTAALEYQKAAQIAPDETNVFEFGTSLFQLDHNAALTILRYGVEKYPGSIKLQVALGTALYADGKTLEGAQHLCQAEELDPKDPNPMELLAETEVVPSEIAPRATALLAELRRRYPQNGLILYDYTMVQSGRWSNSNAMPADFKESLERALQLDPKLPQAYFQLSQLAEEQGRYSEEVQLLKKAIALDKSKEQYHYRLAFAYRKAGDEGGFQTELNQFQKLHDAAAEGR